MEKHSNIHLNSELAERLQHKWEELQRNPTARPRCFIGFDGFTDEILSAVDTRLDDKTFVPFFTIKDFSQRIAAASGLSCNIELIQNQKKLGGNAPIMTNALLNGGHRITFVGTIGNDHQIEPLFQAMTSRCEGVYSLGPSAHSDAIEFEDGKVILGKLAPLHTITYEHILNKIGQKKLLDLLDQADLLACTNWTMIPAMTEIWKCFLKEICPHFKTNKTRYLFVDLADPAKRTDTDLLEALQILTQFNKTHQVILGLNEAEAKRVGQVLSTNSKDIQELAKKLQEKLDVAQIVIHLTQYALSATNSAVVSVDGPYIEKPILKTGGGDNFNAGLCNAILYGLSQAESLRAAVYTSGYYVGNGHSPTIPQLVEFMDKSGLNGL